MSKKKTVLGASLLIGATVATVVATNKKQKGKDQRDKNGKLLSRKSDNSRKYYYSLNSLERKMMADWGKSVSDKTKQYFSNLF